jgi:hypothetical protein
MITGASVAKVANIVGSDAEYGAVKIVPPTAAIRASTNISYRKGRFRNNSAQFRKNFLT